MGDGAPCGSERQVLGRLPRWGRNRLGDPGSKTRPSFLVDRERGRIVGQNSRAIRSADSAIGRCAGVRDVSCAWAREAHSMKAVNRASRLMKT